MSTDAAVAELDFAARLDLCLSGMNDSARRMADAREREIIEWEDCHPIELAPQAGQGPLIDERWGPRTGWAWQVLLLTVTFGAGATAAVLYKTADNSGTVANNARRSFLPDAAGMDSWEPKGLIVRAGQQLAWTAAGGPITVVGEAVEIRETMLARYLM